MKPAISSARSKHSLRGGPAALWERVPLRGLTDCLSESYECASRLADEMFLARGTKFSTKHEDARRIEREVMPWLTVNFEESDGFVRALASARGFRGSDIRVGVEPFWLAILANREDEESPDGCGFHPTMDLPSARREGGSIMTETADSHARAPSQTFCVLSLPAEVNPIQSIAVLANGLLAIRMPKAKSGYSLRRQDRAADGAWDKGVARRKTLTCAPGLWWQAFRAKAQRLFAAPLSPK
ncbi:MAG: hypothetical protein ACRD4C_02820 [Candidatus Acidiferrales bacterium]